MQSISELNEYLTDEVVARRITIDSTIRKPSSLSEAEKSKLGNPSLGTGSLLLTHISSYFTLPLPCLLILSLSIAAQAIGRILQFHKRT